MKARELIPALAVVTGVISLPLFDAPLWAIAVVILGGCIFLEWYRRRLPTRLRCARCGAVADGFYDDLIVCLKCYRNLMDEVPDKKLDAIEQEYEKVFHGR